MSKPRRILRMTPVVVAASLLAGFAQAESLKQLHDQARQYDAAYLAARASADAAEHRLAQSKAVWMPQVSATMSESHAQNTVEVQAAGQTVDVTGSNNVRSGSISLQQSLFNRNNQVTISRAERGVALAKAQLRSAEQDLVIRLSQAYFDVLTAREALANAQASKAAIAEQLASAKRSFEVGTATITDSREAQARFDQAIATEIAAQNDVQVKQLALDQVVGKPGIAPNGVAKSVNVGALTTGTAEDWIQRAEAQSPGIEQARLALETAQLDIEAAKAGHLPTVGLQAQLARSSLATNKASNSVSISASIPLFSGFSVQNRVKETVALETVARDNLEAARRNVILGTRQLFLGTQAGAAQVKALEAAEASNQLALEATQLGYKVGVRVNLDVLNAQTQLYNTRNSLAAARHNLILTQLRLRQTAGQLDGNDLEQVDRLLAN